MVIHNRFPAPRYLDHMETIRDKCHGYIDDWATFRCPVPGALIPQSLYLDSQGSLCYKF